MSQVNTLHQMAYFEEPDLTTRPPSWNCIANVLFSIMFASLVHEVVADSVSVTELPNPVTIIHYTPIAVVQYVSDS